MELGPNVWHTEFVVGVDWWYDGEDCQRTREIRILVHLGTLWQLRHSDRWRACNEISMISFVRGWHG